MLHQPASIPFGTTILLSPPNKAMYVYIWIKVTALATHAAIAAGMQIVHR
jgi:hypothetical protein